eukprot:TRINITY_DN122704_c0_g1_i1.p1 TRINITY_DN122704_c0_g1~~TRINITY_DN122704_c0_g1_i1.p1  ORF type:complete len:787 (-),score=107.61 TRINITY_DN122704_c0_g1_i1:85-2445(-)
MVEDGRRYEEVSTLRSARRSVLETARPLMVRPRRASSGASCSGSSASLLAAVAKESRGGSMATAGYAKVSSSSSALEPPCSSRLARSGSGAVQPQPAEAALACGVTAAPEGSSGDASKAHPRPLRRRRSSEGTLMAAVAGDVGRSGSPALRCEKGAVEGPRRQQVAELNHRGSRRSLGHALQLKENAGYRRQSSADSTRSWKRGLQQPERSLKSGIRSLQQPGRTFSQDRKGGGELHLGRRGRKVLGEIQSSQVLGRALLSEPPEKAAASFCEEPSDVHLAEEASTQVEDSTAVEDSSSCLVAESAEMTVQASRLDSPTTASEDSSTGSAWQSHPPPGLGRSRSCVELVRLPRHSWPTRPEERGNSGSAQDSGAADLSAREPSPKRSLSRTPECTQLAPVPATLWACTRSLSAGGARNARKAVPVDLGRPEMPLPQLVVPWHSRIVPPSLASDSESPSGFTCDDSSCMTFEASALDIASPARADTSVCPESGASSLAGHTSSFARGNSSCRDMPAWPTAQGVASAPLPSTRSSGVRISLPGGCGSPPTPLRFRHISVDTTPSTPFFGKFPLRNASACPTRSTSPSRGDGIDQGMSHGLRCPRNLPLPQEVNLSCISCPPSETAADLSLLSLSTSLLEPAPVPRMQPCRAASPALRQHVVLTQPARAILPQSARQAHTPRPVVRPLERATTPLRRLLPQTTQAIVVHPQPAPVTASTPLGVSPRLGSTVACLAPVPLQPGGLGWSTPLRTPIAPTAPQRVSSLGCPRFPGGSLQVRTLSPRYICSER